MKLKPIKLPSPWQASLLGVGAFPMPVGELDPMRLLLQAFSEIAAREHGLQHEVLLQLWNLSPQTGGEILSANVSEWAPKFGLGVWPDRKPPQAWTEETLVDAAAAVFRGDEPMRPSNRLLRLTIPKNRQIDAADKMRGFGVQLELFSKDSIETIEERGKKFFLPTITERRFQREPFYLPLLDHASLCRADSASQIESWICGVDIYIRESAEDRGILILSRFELEPLVEKTMQRLRQVVPAPE
jgi:hypothetical protein